MSLQIVIKSVSPKLLLTAAFTSPSFENTDTRTLAQDSTPTNSEQLAHRSDGLRSRGTSKAFSQRGGHNDGLTSWIEDPGLNKEVNNSAESFTQSQQNNVNNTSDEEECPSGIDTLDCEECGGPERPWGDNSHIFHCRGIETEGYRWKDCYCMDFTDECGPCTFDRDLDDTPNDRSALQEENLDLAAGTEDLEETSIEQLHKDTTNAPDDEECPTGFDTLDCEDCGGPEHTWEINPWHFHCKGVCGFQGSFYHKRYHELEAGNGSPFWNPMPADAISRACDVIDSSGIISSLWYDIAEMFCAEVDASGGAAVMKDYTSQDFNNATRGRSRTLPPGGSMYSPRWGNLCFFHFEATAEEVGADGIAVCRRTCIDTIYSLTQSCGMAGDEQNCMASESSLGAGCCSYSYRISQPNTDETICAADWLPREQYPFTVDQATDAINQFCSDTLAQVTMPMQPEPFVQDPLVDVSTYPQRSYAYDGTIITIMAAFTDTLGIDAGEGCGPDINFDVVDYSGRCSQVLQEAVNNCETDTTTQKLGGSLIEHESENGCVMWQIWASTLAISKRKT
ncbi:hypothetical protein KCU99_g4888, partial [Aureobasidium melanogenum]